VPGAVGRRLGPEIIAAIAMCEDSGNERRVSNRGDDVLGHTKAAGAYMNDRCGGADVHQQDSVRNNSIQLNSTWLLFYISIVQFL